LRASGLLVGRVRETETELQWLAKELEPNGKVFSCPPTPSIPHGPLVAVSSLPCKLAVSWTSKLQSN